MPDKPVDERTPQEIWAACTRFLGHLGPESVKNTLQALADEVGPDERPDQYGMGTLVQDFEAEIAQLLGKEAAMFLPTGTLTQQVALRVWTERVNRPVIGFHPMCHLEVHEQHAYAVMHGLRPQIIGDQHSVITLDDLKAVPEPLGALLLELPQRDIGGQLPSWDDLQAQLDWARERGIKLHMDGARLWEAQPFYDRPHGDIAAGFDSVYVSFYKGLGALSGSALAGPADFIEECRPWVRRHGGNLFRFYPYVISARKALRDKLDRFPAYHDRAVAIAEILESIPGIRVKPYPLQTNMMHVYLEGDRETLLSRAREIATEDRVGLTAYLSPTDVPDTWMFELSIGEAAFELSDEEIEQYFQRIMA